MYRIRIRPDPEGNFAGSKIQKLQKEEIQENASLFLHYSRKIRYYQ